MGVSIGSSSISAKPQTPSQNTAANVWDIVREEYVADNFNFNEWQRQRQTLVDRDDSNAETTYQAIQVALASLDDPYTRFLTPKQFARVRRSPGGAAANGVMLLRDERDRLVVSAPPSLEGAAAKAGLRRGDVILSIDGTSTANLDASEAASFMLANEDLPVALSIEREGELIEVLLECPPLDRRADVTHTVRREGDREIGYLRITQFRQKTAQRVRDAVASLEEAGVTAYVMDLRANSGGLVEASTAIADMFLSGGDIVTIEGRSGVLKHYEADSYTLTDKPVALIVDRGTASSSELLAAALQDRDRAIAIGARTFGKGIVQSIYTLPDQSSLSVTIAHYRTPDGRIIHDRGLEPDVWVELSERDRDRLSRQQELVATAADPQYAVAVASLTEME
ncbi:MAG: S41 family peptidase, partial [Cyanobacteria bacterium J06648_11]